MIKPISQITLVTIIAILISICSCGEGSKSPKYHSDATTISISPFTSAEAKNEITIDYTFCRFALNEEDAQKGKYIYVDNGDDEDSQAVMKIFDKMVVFNLSHNDNGTITGQSVPDETGSSRFTLEVKKGENILEGGHGFSIHNGSIKLKNAYDKDLDEKFYGECGGGGL